MSSGEARKGRSLRLLWAAALLPPALWAAQGTLGWYVGGHACAALEPGWSPRLIRPVLQLSTVVAAAVVAALLLLARRHQRLAEDAGTASPSRERTRFVAMLAAVAGVTLLLGLVLAGLPAVVVHTCGQAR